jgi:hypothetical protein
MGNVPPLLAYLLLIVSDRVHRRQLIVIEFLQAENSLLKERMHGKRIRFTDAEQALLSRIGKRSRRKTLVTLDTPSECTTYATITVVNTCGWRIRKV